MSSPRIPTRPIGAVSLFAIVSTLVVAGAAGPASAASGPSPASGPTSGGTLVTVDVSMDPVVSLSAGSGHVLALDDSGSLLAWGFNGAGALGDGTMTSSPVPLHVDAPPFVTVSAGSNHSAAVAVDGTAWTWGSNGSGELGTGTNDASLVPVQVTPLPGGRSFVDIQAGSSHTMAVASDGTLWGWGSNSAGELGNGTDVNSSVPVQVTALADRRITQVVTRLFYTMALASDGTAWAWGYNTASTLGNASISESTIPVQVTPPADGGYARIVGGESHVVAIATDGTAWTWGSNFYGQLGLGDIDPRQSPTPLPSPPGGERYVDVAVGTGHTLALASDGTLWAWGLNVSGQLGAGSTTYSTSPLRIPLEARWIAAGDQYSLALTTTGELWSWGRNWGGQLGDGTDTSREAPGPVLTGLTATEVTFGGVAAGAPVASGLGLYDVLTPAHAAGAVDVVVSTAYENGAAGPSFRYPGSFTFLDTNPVTPSAPPGPGAVDPPAPASPAETGPASAPGSGALASTGTDIAPYLVAAALALVLGGTMCGVAVLRHRRRREG